MGAVDAAAKKLSTGSYPFIQDIDWASDIYQKPLPGVSAKEALMAVDKMIVMGASMDAKLLKEAAEAHHKAIGSIDAKGVTTAADYEAVNAALGKNSVYLPGKPWQREKRPCGTLKRNVGMQVLAGVVLVDYLQALCAQ